VRNDSVTFRSREQPSRFTLPSAKYPNSHMFTKQDVWGKGVEAGMSVLHGVGGVKPME